MEEEKILFVLLDKPWKKQCNMPIEIGKQKKEILGHCGFRE
jgi:hypothetical protein